MALMVVIGGGDDTKPNRHASLSSLYSSFHRRPSHLFSLLLFLMATTVFVEEVSSSTTNYSPPSAMLFRAPSAPGRRAFHLLERREEESECGLLSSLLLSSSSSSPRMRKSIASSRRRWLSSSVASAAAAAVFAASASAFPSTSSAAAAASSDQAGNVLPSTLRRYTALAPLGKASVSPPGSKITGLSLQDISDILTRDLTNGSQGRGGYFVTGDLSPEIFRDDCTFIDPTNSVSSLSRYRRALQILFDPKESYVEVVDPLVPDDIDRIIRGRVRGGGVLQLPWRPRIASFENDITYVIDDDGLIKEQRQEWDTSATEALGQTFTPYFLDPPFSTMVKPRDEPHEVTELFNSINGHRPDSFVTSSRRRGYIDSLIDTIVTRRYPWKEDLLVGRWALAYLQLGPDGAGIDRRIPFPEFWFNNSFQSFGRLKGDDVVDGSRNGGDGHEDKYTVTNVGQLLGPLLEVRVSGTVREEVQANDRSRHWDGSVEGGDGAVLPPRRFVADIKGGGLCLGGSTSAPCVPLPMVRGVGLFDGMYVGERIRIGQNINGGGARVVQVRIE